ncbi:Sulfur carrier protein moaD [Kingella potus]|uniref:Molybdopterin synthase sulfur carrier subunit n=1 Tax=Kingella potus TaxID=265175 RepID=A0A377R2W4_9NEIS|nr:molybdopterin converting factor subunit 1 [Kingella potus]UOO99872.1 molybdopterin converting factor subunit 1 [Kingella potus]STR03127.1 Sulfur carrier protein moaD [Kingella potus]
MTSAAEIQILYFAALREAAGKDSETVALDNSDTAAAVYSRLAAQYGFTLPQERLRCAVNHQFAAWDTTLEAGDTLAFIPPVAGG